MVMRAIAILGLLYTWSAETIQAQSLSQPALMFSHRKPAYITKADGSLLEGTLSKVKRKKGLIESITIEHRSKNVNLPARDIASVYLAPTGFDKLSTGLDRVGHMNKWDRQDVDSEKIKAGYVYFENCDVLVRKKKMTLLMQLLNPGFSARLKVFHDPAAGKTGTVSVAGIGIDGGLEKSYYLQRPGEVAYRLTRKDYKKGFDTFYVDCKDLLKQYDKPRWDDFSKHLFYYSENCPGKSFVNQ